MNTTREHTAKTVRPRSIKVERSMSLLRQYEEVYVDAARNCRKFKQSSEEMRIYFETRGYMASRFTAELAASMGIATFVIYLSKENRWVSLDMRS